MSHGSRAGNHQLFWGIRISIESQKLNFNSVRHPDQRIRDPPAPQPEAPNEGLKRRPYRRLLATPLNQGMLLGGQVQSVQ